MKKKKIDKKIESKKKYSYVMNLRIQYIRTVRVAKEKQNKLDFPVLLLALPSHSF